MTITCKNCGKEMHCLCLLERLKTRLDTTVIAPCVVSLRMA